MSLRRFRSGAPALPQRGFALIAMLVLAAMITAFLITVGLNRSSAEISNEREDRNMSALRQAKAALIAYAASEQWQLHTGSTYFQPGSLPCPDQNDDGNQNCAFGSTARSMIGRLPWQSMGIEDLRDSSGERLWYAVSHDFRKMQCPTTNCTTINSDTQGQLTVSGMIAMNNVVAVVIAPGPIILAQTRPNSNLVAAHNDPANYVESFASGDWVHFNFATNAIPDLNLNDRLVVITQADLMAAVEPVVAAQIARDVKPLLNTFASQWGAFPFPANFAPDPGTSGGATTRSPMTFLGDSSQWSGLPPIASVPVSGASNASPILITTASPHALTTGDTIWVSGVQGNTNANGKWTVTVVDTTHFQLNASSGSGSYTQGGSVTPSYPWSGWSVTKVSGSGRIDTDSCSALATSSGGLQCTFQAHDDTCGLITCVSNLRFRIQAQAGKVGLTLALLPDVATVVTQVAPNPPASFPAASMTGGPLGNTGVGTMTYTATLPAAQDCGPCSVTYNITVTIPDVITNPAISAYDTNVGWFIANEWYRQTYYALANDSLPGGSNNCIANPPCLTVNDLPGGPVGNRQAILLLAGRALGGQNRPPFSPITPNDYLDGVNQTAFTTRVFDNRSGTPTSINDRVVLVAP